MVDKDRVKPKQGNVRRILHTLRVNGITLQKYGYNSDINIEIAL
jgi:hypothetical protein